MPAQIYSMKFDGPVTKRGFWLYVCKITYKKAGNIEEVLYVGRNGDSSSKNASSPFVRMGQHLGRNKNNNQMRRRLEELELQPEECTAFELFAYPLFPENPSQHEKLRDKVDALEKALARTLKCGTYTVLNKDLNSKKNLDPVLWRDVCQAFAEPFPELKHAHKQW